MDWRDRDQHQQRFDHRRLPRQDSFENGDFGYHRSTYSVRLCFVILNLLLTAYMLSQRVDLGVATQEDLVRARNQAYLSLERKHDILFARYQELK